MKSMPSSFNMSGSGSDWTPRDKLKGPSGSNIEVLPGKELGRGSFGAVCEGSYNGEKAAMKQYYSSKAGNEYEILQYLKDKNTTGSVRLLGDLFQIKQDWYLPLELCKGSLKGEHSMSKDRQIVGMVESIAELHAVGVYHRDIKLDNFLISQDDKVKLADFGTSVRGTGNISEEEVGSFNVEVGSYVNFDPISSAKASKDDFLKLNDKGLERGDVFALGATIYQLLSGQFVQDTLKALDSKGPKQNLLDISVQDKGDKLNDFAIILFNSMHYKGAFEATIEEPTDGSLSQLLYHMLTPNPEERYTMKDVVDHTSFKEMKAKLEEGRSLFDGAAKDALSIEDKYVPDFESESDDESVESVLTEAGVPNYTPDDDDDLPEMWS